MNRTDKLNEGQVQIDDIHNYRPLDNHHRLIQSLLQEGHIDDMTAKWLSLTPDPPRIPVFYTLTKIHKPTPVGRPIISGCDGPTERISVFVDHLIQPIAQKQATYLKDTTDVLNFLSQWTSPGKPSHSWTSIKPGTWNIPEHPGASRNMKKSKYFFMKKILINYIIILITTIIINNKKNNR